MLSTVLITFIYCRPNKWNNQGPLIQAASGAGGCVRVLNGSTGKRLESPLESRAVINEQRTATNYMHRPKKKKEKGRHTHTFSLSTYIQLISFLLLSPALCLTSFSPHFYHFFTSHRRVTHCREGERAKCCESTLSSSLLMLRHTLSLNPSSSSPSPFSPHPRKNLWDYWKSMKCSVPVLNSNLVYASLSD